MYNRKRRDGLSEDDFNALKKIKMDDDGMFKNMVVSRLLWRYAMMSRLSSMVCRSLRTTTSLQKLPISHTLTLLLPKEYRRIVGGGFVAFVAKQLSLDAGTYRQPISNGRQYCGWMDCILRRVTAGLIRPMAKANYEAGKALMLFKKFAIGASFLEKAILLGHNGARALLAYYLIHGREGLPADPSRASDLASDGADDSSQECQLVMATSIAMEVILTPWAQGDSTLNAKYWLREANKEPRKIDDPALAAMLYNLAQGLILSQLFTIHLPPRDMTRIEAHEKAAILLMSTFPGIPDCEMNYMLGIMSGRVDHDFIKEAFHLTIAANQGHPEAFFHLAHMHYCGIGVDEDHKIGKKLMRKAIEAGSKSPENWGYMID